jgi:catechol-2,3-dioxygenase
MKRFHIHIGVKDLHHSVQFYSTLFGQQPTKLKNDYAKWMLEDPKVNFAISTRVKDFGVDHLGIQVDESSELSVLTERLKKADLGVYGEGETTCCYAETEKAWVKDPSGIAWETYHTMNDVEVFSEKPKPAASACCAPKATTTKSCC